MLRDLLRYLHRRLAPPDYERLRSLGGHPAALSSTVAALLDGVPRPVFILGIEQRSGTNYLGLLLAEHPSVTAFPDRVFEVPVLRRPRGLYEAEHAVHAAFDEKWGRLPRGFVPALVGAGLLRHLAGHCSPGTRPLLKDPSVRNLRLFDDFFPDAPLLVLSRDGRDVVASKVRTWPDQPFARVCSEWAAGAAAIARFRRELPDRPATALLRYEDLVADTRAVLEPAMATVGLDPALYDWTAVDRVPVLGSSKMHAGGQVQWNPRERPDDFRTGGGWDGWSAVRQRIFRRICGAGMESLGYW